MKYFIFGDIHGNMLELSMMMDKLQIDPPTDTLIFLGDYIDRGPDSFDVIRYLIQLNKDFRCKFIMGNHEKMMLDVFNNEVGSKQLWLYNGGSETLKSYAKYGFGNIENIPSSHLNFLYELKIYNELPRFFFVHAGINPRNIIQTDDDMLWIREGFIDDKKDFGKVVVFGHTPFNEPLVQDNKIGIDTGLTFGGKLTCLELSKGPFSKPEDYKFHFVEKIK